MWHSFHHHPQAVAFFLCFTAQPCRKPFMGAAPAGPTLIGANNKLSGLLQKPTPDLESTGSEEFGSSASVFVASSGFHELKSDGEIKLSAGYVYVQRE